MSGKHFKQPGGANNNSSNPYSSSRGSSNPYSNARTSGGHYAGSQSSSNPYTDQSTDPYLYSGKSVSPNDTFVGRVEISEFNGDHYKRLSKQKKHRHTGLKIMAALLIALLVVFGVSAGFAYASYKEVKDDAQELVTIGQDALTRVKSGDTSGLSDTATQVTNIATDMQSKLNAPFWNILATTPVYGGDINEARQLVDVLVDLCNKALVPAAAQLDGVSLGTLLVDGGIDVNALQSILAVLSDVSEPILEARDTINAMSTKTHISQINTVVAKAQSAMSGIDTMIEIADQVSPYLPQMLGANGETRNYLIIAMQNSELRPCGGFPGAQALLTVTDGKINLGSVYSAAGTDYNGATITDDELRIFKDDSSINMEYRSGDSFTTPDFYRAAENVAHIWIEAYGSENNLSQGDIDGVVAIDPVVIQKFMRVTGGMTLSTGEEVNADNASTFISKTIYKEYGGSADYLFEEIASYVFSNLLHGLGDASLTDLFGAISEGIEEDRLLIYFANEQERVLPELLGCTGTLSVDETAEPEAGVYLSNYTYGKIDMYLDFQVTRGDPIDNGDGSLTYYMTASLTNNITDEDIVNDGWFVTGDGTGGQRYATGDAAYRIFLFAPAGGSVEVVSSKGFNTFKSDEYEGLELERAFVNVNPGETVTVDFKVTTSTASNGQQMSVRATPTVGEAQSMGAISGETVLERD